MYIISFMNRPMECLLSTDTIQRGTQIVHVLLTKSSANAEIALVASRINHNFYIAKNHILPGIHFCL